MYPIYTTYFGNLKNLPEYVIPISIAVKPPEWYEGAQYKKLAPKYDFFTEWKQTHNNEKYIECFCKQVLDELNAQRVIHELYDIAMKQCYGNFGYSITGHTDSIALVCYEKPREFCHRRLVAEWLRLNGYDCKEW